jgi:hypothetical protein
MTSNWAAPGKAFLRAFPIPVGRRLRNDQEVNLVTRVIPHLMRCACWNPNPFSGCQCHWSAIHFHDSFARKNVEELLRMMVEVANLRRARRHTLLNYAQLRILYQVPAITAVCPSVMLGFQLADCVKIHCHKLTIQEITARFRPGP